MRSNDKKIAIAQIKAIQDYTVARLSGALADFYEGERPVFSEFLAECADEPVFRNCTPLTQAQREGVVLKTLLSGFVPTLRNIFCNRI